MKNLLWLISLSIFLISCSGGKKQSAKNTEQKIVPKLLAEANIFVPDSVKPLAEKASRDQTTKAKILFFQGLDLLVNKQNPVEGIKLFRESALYNPDSKTYYYLANAYIDKNDTGKANAALTMASELGYEEEDEIYYSQARMSALLGDTSTALSQLETAFQMGFINKPRIEADKSFDKIRNVREFTAIMVYNFKDEVKLRAKLFKTFLASFPDANFPLEIPKDSIPKINSDNFVNYDFASFIPGMEDGRFARDVTNEYLAISKFTVDKNITAVIYKMVMAIVDTLPPVEIKIATYDSTGKVLDELIFGDFTLPSTLTVGSIDENQIINLKRFKINWKKDPTEEGYAGNEWLSEDLVNEDKFKIDETGHFVIYAPDKTAVVNKQ